MERGDLASIVVTYLEDREGKALVRLPNGSKTRVDPGALMLLPGRGHLQRSDAGQVKVWCEDCDWHEVTVGGHAAQAALAAHQDAHEPQGAG